MLKLVILLLAGVVGALGAFSVPPNYLPCTDISIKTMGALDLIKFSGTWYSVSSTIPNLPNNTDMSVVQQAIDDYIGCDHIRLDLSNANQFNYTVDDIFRNAINDTSRFPPDVQIINKNEARYQVNAYSASEAKNDPHWILEMRNKTGEMSIDIYTIDTNYKGWALWYLCYAPPGGASPQQQQVEMWGVLSRSPQKFNVVQKLAFKTVARVAGVDIAFTDYLFDFPQDMCF